MTLDTSPRVAVASVLAPEGNVVASGRMGLGASYAVADQIVTDERHRRLGLGTVVMAALERLRPRGGTRAGRARCDR